MELSYKGGCSMVAQSSGLIDSSAKSWLSENRALSPLGSAWSWLFPREDGRTTYPEHSGVQRNRPLWGFSLRSEDFFEQFPCWFPTDLALLIDQHRVHALSSHGQDQWGGSCISASHGGMVEQWTGVHTTTGSSVVSQVCLCVFSPIGLLFQSVFICSISWDG